MSPSSSNLSTRFLRPVGNAADSQSARAVFRFTFHDSADVSVIVAKHERQYLQHLLLVVADCGPVVPRRGPHDPTRVLFLSSVGTLGLRTLSPFLLRLTGVAIQKSCKRRIHVTSLTSSTTTTQLPGPGAVFAPSTGRTSSPTRPHTSHRTHSTPSTTSLNSRKNSQGGQSKISHVVTSGTPEELASHLNKAFGKLVFPPELATRLLTHASHPVSRVVGFAFTGECFCPFDVNGSLPALLCHTCPAASFPVSASRCQWTSMWFWHYLDGWNLMRGVSRSTPGPGNLVISYRTGWWPLRRHSSMRFLNMQGGLVVSHSICIL